MVNVLEQINERLDGSFRTANGAVRGGLAGDPPGFSNLDKLPSPSGSNVRQAKIASLRSATATRNMVRFFLPEVGVVEMYINPQGIKYNDKKHIPAPTRTRGGYLIQYWGEELGTISINGTTGSSGVEGINVLYDIYRNEQVAMDALALAATAASEKQEGLIDSVLGADNLLTGVGNALGVGVDSLFDQVNSVIETGNISPVTPKPTLASIAFQTEMYWSGWVFRGYFNSMNVTESADKIGLFEYDLQFTVTQKRGLRLNFFPWHRSAVEGPSNSDPAFGPSYSFSNLRDPIPRRDVAEQTLSQLKRTAATIDQALQSARPLQNT